MIDIRKVIARNIKYQVETRGVQLLRGMAEHFIDALNKTTSGTVLEIGTYFGGSAMLWLDLMKEMKEIRPFFTIDPGINKTGFVIAMERLANRAKELSETEIIWRHFPVYDSIFIEAIYPRLSEKFQHYAFVYLDGPHDFDSVIREFKFFRTKVVKGGIILIDDAGSLQGPGAYIVSDLAKGFKWGDFPNHLYLKKE